MTINITALGEITASDDVLNFLSIALKDASTRKTPFSKTYRRYSDTIYSELEKAGYYDELLETDNLSDIIND